MILLPPRLSAGLAAGVYNVNENPLALVSERVALVGCEPDFSVPRSESEHDHPLARSTSGSAPNWIIGVASDALKTTLFSPIESDFGYVAMGNGNWKGHMIVVARGTMGPNKWSADWLSNYNIGMELGPSGRLVHAGFLRVWKGLRRFVEQAVTKLQPSYIHCVGHSLGGALANLSALSLSQDGHEVALYTFGAPRVGGLDFATEMSLRLRGRVKRVYHPADPVPMIPLLPFLHAPLNAGIRLAVPAGALVDADKHDIKRSYGDLVGKASNWNELEAGNTWFGDFQIDNWLQQAAKQKGGFMLRSAALLDRIAEGLLRLISKAAIAVIGSGLSAAVTSTLTALDFVAWLLARAAAIGRTMWEEITGLVKAIFGFLGRVKNSVVNLTQTALRWVLDLLFSFLANLARNAVDRLL